MTFNKVRTDTQFSQINTRWRKKNHETITLLILGLLLGQLYCFKITSLDLQILIQMLVFHVCFIFIKFVTL